jgi:GTP-binding protein
MRFIDEATIRIAGGHGGPGCVSFRRETFVPRGGPDGGDGGEGGDVIFVANEQLSSLQDFRYKRVYQAENGKHGSGTNKAGRDGEDIQLKIPVGTLIKDAQTGEVLVDFVHDGQTWIACKGGRGGKGNAHFVSSTFQAPKFAQPGEDGTSLEIKLELKLLADVAIIGFPNAGKSTFISRISAARPKIADYAFTTLTPNLGVVEMDEHQGFVVADIPGLIEGAHRGLGLGHRFLKHIERTRVFLHLLDGSQFLEDATQPDLEGDESFKEAVEKLVNRYSVIRNELGLFNESLLHKPEIVCLNKLDVLASDLGLVERARVALRQRISSIRGFHPINGEPFVISAVAGTGVKELLGAIQGQLREHPIGDGSEKAISLPDGEDIRK